MSSRFSLVNLLVWIAHTVTWACVLYKFSEEMMSYVILLLGLLTLQIIFLWLLHACILDLFELLNYHRAGFEVRFPICGCLALSLMLSGSYAELMRIMALTAARIEQF